MSRINRRLTQFFQYPCLCAEFYTAAVLSPRRMLAIDRFTSAFLPRDAMRRRGTVSRLVSVTFVYCIQTAKYISTLFRAHHSGILKPSSVTQFQGKPHQQAR